MAKMKYLLVALSITDIVSHSLCGMQTAHHANLTEQTRIRKKRWLIFENGGIAKLNIGPIIAIPFGDPAPWRSMICGYNIHVGEYPLPPRPIYPWDKWETIYARSQVSSPLQPDQSREFMYLALEYFLEKTKGNGRDCFLRSICENAQIDQHMDTFGEILNVILTPGKEHLDPVYREASEMGKSGVNCLHYYSKCPKGQHFFDQFIDEDV